MSHPISSIGTPGIFLFSTFIQSCKKRQINVFEYSVWADLCCSYKRHIVPSFAAFAREKNEYKLHLCRLTCMREL